MNPKVYNACILIGVLLIGVGTALRSISAALVVTGSLVLGLTVLTALLASKR